LYIIYRNDRGRMYEYRQLVIIYRNDRWRRYKQLYAIYRNPR
jgi:hypothetical protein